MKSTIVKNQPDQRKNRSISREDINVILNCYFDEKKNQMSKKYVEGDLVVLWNAELCIHSGKCVQGLPKVFDPNRRPWIDLTQAEQQEIEEQVKRCPSGALSLADTIRESQSTTNDWVTVEVMKNGPLAIKSSCKILMSDGSVKEQEKASFFCRCGGSQNKPFCDGSHKKINFKDE